MLLWNNAVDAGWGRGAAWPPLCPPSLLPFTSGSAGDHMARIEADSSQFVQQLTW